MSWIIMSKPLSGELELTCGACNRTTNRIVKFTPEEQVKILNFMCQCGADVKTTVERPKEAKPIKMFSIKPIRRGRE